MRPDAMSRPTFWDAGHDVPRERVLCNEYTAGTLIVTASIGRLHLPGPVTPAAPKSRLKGGPALAVSG